MKTMYEAVIKLNINNIRKHLLLVTRLVKLSESFPWILDPKNKFGECGWDYFANAFYFDIKIPISKKKINRRSLYFFEKDNEYLFDSKNDVIYPVKSETALQFKKRIESMYNLRPGWMTIENSV